MDNTINQKIINLMTPISKGLTVADVRIGLAYTSVRLDNGNTGVSWTAHRVSKECTHLMEAGTFAGRPAYELLNMLADKNNSLFRTVGLATANALAADKPHPETVSVEVLKLINLQPTEHVVMVGFFGPLIPRIRKTGCRLDILELKSDKPGTISPEEGRSALEVCDVAIITATSVVTGTIDELLSGLGNVRAAIILGPSSFMRPEVFSGTPITHIAGVKIRDASAVERIISEGGGTRILKQHMDFETICINH